MVKLNLDLDQHSIDELNSMTDKEHQSEYIARLIEMDYLFQRGWFKELLDEIKQSEPDWNLKKEALWRQYLLRNYHVTIKNMDGSKQILHGEEAIGFMAKNLKHRNFANDN